MKRFLIAVVFLAVLLGGCSGVRMNAEYSQLLNKTVALSAEAATRAEAGALTPEQMTQLLRWNATGWRYFADARDGRASE